METNILIIGGSAAGLTAAINARKLYPDKKITVIRKDKAALIPCAIPYIFGTLKSTENDVIPDAMYEQLNVELINDEVKDLDFDNKVVKTSSNEISYEKLILGLGSHPNPASWLKGSQLENVYLVPKTKDYLDLMNKTLQDKQEIVIIGGGFIGVEVADELSETKKVTIIEVKDRLVSNAFDADFSKKIYEELTKKGVNILLNTKVDEIVGNNTVEGVKVNGQVIKADAVIVSVGYLPNTDLVKGKLELNKFGMIKVNEYMEAREDVFATGDCASKIDYFKDETAIMLASIATHDAIIAVQNLYDKKIKRNPIIPVFSTNVNNLGFGCVGFTEEYLKSKGIEFVVGYSKTINRHPPILEGNQVQEVKIIVSKEGQILGFQMAGDIGELINVGAAIVQSKMNVKELINFEFATHPKMTSSPVSYPIINSAFDAFIKLNKA